MSSIISIAAENSNGKSKKGGGTNAVLTLMKELADFQDKVQSCIDAQDISDRKKDLGFFYDKLDEMAEVLLEMAADGIKSKRQIENRESEGDVEEPIEGDKKSGGGGTFKLDEISSLGKIQMVNTPSIPRLPR